MKQDDAGFYRQQQDDIDPGVSSTLSAGMHRQAAQHMSKKEREKARRQADRKAKQAERNRAAKERRVDFLIDPDVKARNAEAAHALGCSKSQVAEFALRYLFSAIDAGEVDLSFYLEPLTHPAYTHRLIYPEISTNP